MTKTKTELLTHLEQCYFDKYSFAPNEHRKDNYKQIVNTIDNAIKTPLNKIQVLCPPTGTGKTFVLAEYVKHCLGSIHTFGIEFKRSILIVVKTTKQADELVSHINANLPKKIAITCHSDNDISVGEGNGYQALVITHAAYTYMLLEIHDACPIGKLKTSYLYYKGCLRDAVVIDEKPMFVKSWVCSEADLKNVRGYITASIEKEFYSEVRFFDEVIEKLVSVKEYESYQFQTNHTLKFNELAKKLTKQKLDINATGDKNNIARRGINNKVRLIMLILNRLTSSQAVIQKKGNSFEIAVYAKLAPEGCEISTVIFDATAPSDYTYNLIADRINLIKPNKHSRTYQNLKLHVSKGCKVGKAELVNNFDKHVKHLQTNLDKCISPDKKLLLICHKDNVSKINKLKHKALSSASITNWGNIDGKNDFKDCNSVFIFGLPYLPNFTLLVEVIALTGLQLNDSNQIDGDSLSLPQLVCKLKQGYLTSSIIQAINRCQIRSPSNFEGACLKTDIYLPLGTNKDETNFILKSITDQMPNVNIVEWEYLKDTKPFKLSQNLQGLLDYILSCPKDVKHSLKELGIKLKISKGTYDRFKGSIKDGESDIAKAFKKEGIIFQSKDSKRWPDQWLVRVSNTLSSEVEHAIN